MKLSPRADDDGTQVFTGPSIDAALRAARLAHGPHVDVVRALRIVSGVRGLLGQARFSVVVRPPVRTTVTVLPHARTEPARPRVAAPPDADPVRSALDDLLDAAEERERAAARESAEQEAQAAAAAQRTDRLADPPAEDRGWTWAQQQGDVEQLLSELGARAGLPARPHPALDLTAHDAVSLPMAAGLALRAGRPDARRSPGRGWRRRRPADSLDGAPGSQDGADLPYSPTYDPAEPLRLVDGQLGYAQPSDPQPSDEQPSDEQPSGEQAYDEHPHDEPAGAGPDSGWDDADGSWASSRSGQTDWDEAGWDQPSYGDEPWAADQGPAFGRPALGTGWDRDELRRLGVPTPVLSRLPIEDPSDDAGWRRALLHAIRETVPPPALPDAQHPVVVSGHGLLGAVAVLRAAVEDGCTPGVLCHEGRQRPATPAALVDVLAACVRA